MTEAARAGGPRCLLEGNGRCVLAVAILISLAFWSYQQTLSSLFTGTDVFALIESNRVTCVEDIEKMFTRPLMDGTEFLAVAKFYRPLAGFSYAVDHAIWGLRPFGFHLTNLILHICATVGVGMLMRSLAGRDTAFGFLSGAIFALHPILVETVPAIDRRHDILAGLFVTVALALFSRASKTEANRRIISGLSLIAYCMALGGKETAIVTPILICAYSFLFQSEGSAFKRLAVGLRSSLPYIVVTFLYVGWRIYVLEGVGGYVRTPADENYVQAFAMNAIHQYTQDLLYPVDFLGCMRSDWGIIPTCIMVMSVCAYLGCYFSSHRGSSEMLHSGGYVKPVIFCLTWNAALMVLFVLSLTFSHRSMYMAAIPFSGIVAGTFLESWRLLRKKATVPSHDAPRSWPRFCQGLVATAGLIICITFVWYSPLLRGYGQWADSARVSNIFLESLRTAVKDVPGNCTIHVYDLPEGIASYKERIPQVKEVTYLRDYAIKSWLELNFPRRAFKVFVHSRSWLRTFGGSLNIVSTRLGPDAIRITVGTGHTRHRPWTRRIAKGLKSSNSLTPLIH